MAKNGKIAWVLGAGFSKSLGGPLLYDMLTSKTLAEISHKFRAVGDLVNLYGNYESHRRPGGDVYWRHAEEFFDFVDTAQKPGPRQEIIKRLFPGVDPQIVYGRCVQAIVAETSFATDGDLESEAWQPYVRWAESLTRDDSIITFNYDLVLEHLGTHEKAQFLRRKGVYGTSGDAFAHATIYKLHGSIDWLKPQPGQPIQGIRPVLGIVPAVGARVDARARCLNHQRVELNFGQRSWRRREKAPFPALMSPPSTV